MEISLFELPIGRAAVVKSFSDESLLNKLYNIGLLPGTLVHMNYAAAFNDPLCISYGKELRRIAIRKEEALQIQVEILDL